MESDPTLPADLHLVHLDRADSARAECCRRALSDDPEGTLVWVDHPSDPRARDGRAWLVDDAPGLHAALLLRPGLPAADCAELGIVALVALGRAIAAQVQPMTEMHFRWPNDVLLDGGKAAGVWLDAGGEADRIDWLVISWAVNTDAAPARLGFDAAALAREGAAGPVDAGELLQAIARQLVAAIATWDESGFGPVLQSWNGRFAPGHATRIGLPDGRTIAGTTEAVDASGALNIRADAATHRVSLAAFFGLAGDAS